MSRIKPTKVSSKDPQACLSEDELLEFQKYKKLKITLTLYNLFTAGV
jgi:hypothetical protein